VFGISDGCNGCWGKPRRRYWPEEGNKWVLGIITDYNADTNEHTIIYDINSGHETWEHFDFE
jgi:hypothetical protein